MKHILAILALTVAFVPQQANAQIDTSPWYGVPANPQSGTIPSGSAYFKYPNAEHAKALEAIEKAKVLERLEALINKPAPAMKPIPLPPVKYDREYSGGKLTVLKEENYILVRYICKEPDAIACSYRVHNDITGRQISCLVILGPIAHNDERALRHEIGHCNGWSANHEGAR